jgi:hypothetical protein
LLGIFEQSKPGIPGLTYEIEMFSTVGWLSNPAQQTIICEIIGEYTGDKNIS